MTTPASGVKRSQESSLRLIPAYSVLHNCSSSIGEGASHVLPGGSVQGEQEDETLAVNGRGRYERAQYALPEFGKQVVCQESQAEAVRLIRE
jgi:hypothetical protein